MTIDEAIKKYKDIANTDDNCPRHCMRHCEECVQEHKQLAEWLEELKSYRASVFSGDMTQSMLKEERNKAIDDFVNACDEQKVLETYYCVSMGEIRYIAEQLKAGGCNILEI